MIKRKASCESCPYNTHNKVQGIGPYPSKIMIIGEAPGEQEEHQGLPFVGPAGAWLNKVLKRTGINREDIYITNTICCRPPKNNIGSIDSIEAIKNCKEGLLKEIAVVDPNVIITLGNTAKDTFGISGQITKVRGSIFKHNNAVVIPTYHPSYIMRGNFKEEDVWLNDFKKAKRYSEERYKEPKENFILYPTLAEVRFFVEESEGDLLACDIETTGLCPDDSEIVVLSLAKNSTDAISIPFYKKGGVKYWHKDEEELVKYMIKKAFFHSPVMFQNALFDVSHLMYHGFVVPNILHDTMILHSITHPLLFHNLGFLTSIYGETPYWKGSFKDREGSIFDIEDIELRIYNCRDSITLMQILNPMLEELSDEQRVIYNKQMSLVIECVNTYLNGVKVDKALLDEYIESIYKEIDSIEACFPFDMNLVSIKQVHDYVYSLELPASVKKLSHTVDSAKLKNIVSHIEKRIAQLKTFSFDTVDKVKLLEESKSKINMILEHRNYTKIVNACSNLPRWKDGKVHFKYRLDKFMEGDMVPSSGKQKDDPGSICNMGDGFLEIIKKSNDIV